MSRHRRRSASRTGGRERGGTTAAATQRDVPQRHDAEAPECAFCALAASARGHFVTLPDGSVGSRMEDRLLVLVTAEPDHAVFVAPPDHVANLAALGDGFMASFLAGLRRLTRAVEEVAGASGATFEPAGASAAEPDHVSFRVIPTGRVEGWPPGLLDPHILARRLKEALRRSQS